MVATVDHDGLAIALFMRLSGVFTIRFRMVEPSRFGRLLSVCCPGRLVDLRDQRPRTTRGACSPAQVHSRNEVGAESTLKALPRLVYVLGREDARTNSVYPPRVVDRRRLLAIGLWFDRDCGGRLGSGDDRRADRPR